MSSNQEREQRLSSWLADSDDLYSAGAWAEQIDADVSADHRALAELRLLVDQLLAARRPTSPPAFVVLNTLLWEDGEYVPLNRVVVAVRHIVEIEVSIDLAQHFVTMVNQKEGTFTHVIDNGPEVCAALGIDAARLMPAADTSEAERTIARAEAVMAEAERNGWADELYDIPPPPPSAAEGGAE